MALKFMAFILFQMDQLLLFNLREIRDKVQSKIYWKNWFPQLAIMQNWLSAETVHHWSQERAQSRAVLLSFPVVFCGVQTHVPHSSWLMLKTESVPYGIPKDM